MREKSAVALFLFALGGIKWFEYRNEESEDGEFEKDYQFAKTKKKIQRRSIESQTERWMMERYSAEMLEVQNGAGMRATIDCSAVAETECSCTFLQCFGQPLCQRNVTGQPRHTFIRCRSAVVYDQVLCECKRHTQLPPNRLGGGVGGGGGGGGRSLLEEQKLLRRRKYLLRQQQQQLSVHKEPPLPMVPGGGEGVATN